MELEKRYSFEGSVPMRFTERSAGIDLTLSLYYRASFLPAGADGAGLREAAAGAVALAYAVAYPDGMSGLPEETPGERVRDLAGADLSRAAARAGLAAEGFSLDRQWILENDRATWLRMTEAARLTDPAAVAARFKEAQAEAIRSAQTAGREGKIRWICACGSVNDMGFCPECGQKRSFLKWLCPCGSENGNRFCPECGRSFDS